MSVIGRTIGGFQVVEKIREGGFSTVYKGVSASGHVAIKLIREDVYADASKRKAFKREGKILSKLSHPFVVKMLAYSDGPPRPYMVLEFFATDTLKAILLRHLDRIDGKEFRILRQTAEALAYIHEQGIVHCDLKPENILITDSLHICLIDFSISQTGWPGLFGFGRKAQGTPLYMAPEQIRAGKMDKRTDQYSFGVLAYEMLAKRPVFLGVQDQILQQHLNLRPEPLRRTLPLIRPDLDNLVLKMLEKNPENRFFDMIQVVHYLKAYEVKESKEKDLLKRWKGSK